MKIFKRARNLFRRNNVSRQKLETEKDKDKELANSSPKQIIHLEPFRNHSRMNNKWRNIVSYRSEPYPEDLNPFLGDYPDILNPFLDEKEGYPEEMNPFGGDSEDSQIVVDDAIVENNRDEQHRVDSIEDIRSEISFQDNSPSVSLSNISDVISLDYLFSPLRKSSAVTPNFDKLGNEYSTDSQVATPDYSMHECVNNHEQIEKGKDRNKEDRNIFEEFVLPLHDDTKSEVMPSGYSFKTAPFPSAFTKDPDEREMETRNVEKVSDINNFKDSESQVKNKNTSTPVLEDVENSADNTTCATALAIRESRKKDNKAKCLSSSPPNAKNFMESFVVENSDRVSSSVRQSRKKRRAPLPPPLQKQTQATTQEIGCSRYTTKMTKINITKGTAVTPPRPSSRCGEKLKKNDTYPVSKDVIVLKPSRPAPPVPIPDFQKPEAGKKGVRGFWKRIFHRKK